jgi:hypothetical protein
MLHFKGTLKVENDETGRVSELEYFIQADSKNDAVDQLGRIVHYYLNTHPKMFFKRLDLVETVPYI